MALTIRSIPYRMWLLVVLVVCHIISAINPTDTQDFIFEHIPTAAFLIFIIIYDRRSKHGPLSNLSYTLLLGFTLLHILGAHYLYTNVPYNDWSEAVLGQSINDLFGWQRNHYDRLVHLMFGVLCLKPMDEVVMRFFTVRRVQGIVIAVLMLTFLSTVYEWAEWFLSIMVSPEAAENYNGQQGDMFDAQKDMVLAFVGSLVSAGILVLRQPRSIRTA